jgi:hypothetical protein
LLLLSRKTDKIDQKSPKVAINSYKSPKRHKKRRKNACKGLVARHRQKISQKITKSTILTIKKNVVCAQNIPTLSLKEG